MMLGNSLILIGSFTIIVSIPLESMSTDDGLTNSHRDIFDVVEDFSDDYSDDLKNKREWKMRMFKRDPVDTNLYEDYNENDSNKRGQPWKMRMFKRSRDPWKMRMFKRFPIPYYWSSQLEKKSPWKMRMFKRYTNINEFKRPDKWQMRMFKRDPELGMHSMDSAEI